VKSKYQLVKQHDRVGRMADTLEYSDVAFPLSRFDDALVRELEQHAPSMIEYQRSKEGGTRSSCAISISSAA
jgi:isocitrate dehydrogenase kinase/phosphatase